MGNISFSYTATYNFTESVQILMDNSYWAAYHVLIPTVFVLAFSSRMLSLLAFYIQSKSEPAYLLQIFVASAEAFEAFSFTLSTATWYVWLEEKWGHMWFLKCYFCMFVGAHFANTMQMGGLFCSIFLTLRI